MTEPECDHLITQIVDDRDPDVTVVYCVLCDSTFNVPKKYRR